MKWNGENWISASKPELPETDSAEKPKKKSRVRAELHGVGGDGEVAVGMDPRVRLVDQVDLECAAASGTAAAAD